MATAPAKLCNHAGCQLVATHGNKCKIHATTKVKKAKPKRINYKRQSSTQRGYDSKWRNERLYHLDRNPLCVHCQAQNILEPATVVDHIIPHRGNKHVFWDKKNWQSLCKRCHDIKTTTVDRKLPDSECLQLWEGG